MGRRDNWTEIGRMEERKRHPSLYNKNPMKAPYGYCPQCGEPGISRERRPDGNDRCLNGHVYKSRNALTIQPSTLKDAELHVLRAEISNAVELIKRLQWKGRAHGSMGYTARKCPLCDQMPKGEFLPVGYLSHLHGAGHEESCDIRKFLERYDETSTQRNHSADRGARVSSGNKQIGTGSDKGLEATDRCE